MSDGIVTETGRLRDEFLSAAYFDSSIVIDYWLAAYSQEPLRGEVNGRIFGFDKESSVNVYEFLGQILKTGDRVKKVTEIRQRLAYGKAKVTAVISPLCLLELAEWKAEIPTSCLFHN